MVGFPAALRASAKLLSEAGCGRNPKFLAPWRPASPTGYAEARKATGTLRLTTPVSDPVQRFLPHGGWLLVCSLSSVMPSMAPGMKRSGYGFDR